MDRRPGLQDLRAAGIAVINDELRAVSLSLDLGVKHA